MDPGLPRGGGANPSGGANIQFLPNFPKNCMKLKEFGPGRVSKILLCRSATVDQDKSLPYFYWGGGVLQCSFSRKMAKNR